MPDHTSGNIPAPRQPEHISNIIHRREQTLFQGPLPSPDAFAAYDRVLAGAADRILKMAETQAGHRQKLESRALRGDLTKALMGVILAYITFASSMFGAVFLLINDKPIQSLVALATALAAAFGPKIYADFIQPKPPESAHEHP